MIVINGRAFRVIYSVLQSLLSLLLRLLRLIALHSLPQGIKVH